MINIHNKKYIIIKKGTLSCYHLGAHMSHLWRRSGLYPAKGVCSSGGQCFCLWREESGGVGSGWVSIVTYFVLTHLTLDKVAAILADGTFKCIFLNGNNRLPIGISLKFVPRCPINNKPALVRVMAWCRTGDKPFPETMITLFTDAICYKFTEIDVCWSNW